jgi:hypothetical protein
MIDARDWQGSDVGNYSNEEVLTLRTLLAMREAQLAESLSEIERLKSQCACKSVELASSHEQNSGSAGQV